MTPEQQHQRSNEPTTEGDRYRSDTDGAHTAAANGDTAAYDTRRTDDDRDVMTVDAGNRKPSYGLGSLLALLAALGIAVSVFFDWVQGGTGVDAPVQFLWDFDTTASDPSLLFVLLPAAALVLIGTFIPRLRWVAILGGAVALATAILFFISVARAFDTDSALENIKAGVWIAAASGLLAIIGSLIIPRRPAELR